MKHKTPEELKKMESFVLQRAEAIPKLVEHVEEGIKDKPEGKEITFLKRILENYIRNRDNFVAHFISGEPGKRGVDQLIRGLEHPESEVMPDKALIKKLKKLARKAEDARLPAIDEIRHYEILRQDVSRISTDPDIHKFIRKFNDLLVRAMRFEGSEVAEAIKSRSLKRIPNIIRLEEFEFSITVWKLMFSRLYWPSIERKALGIIGSLNLDGFEEIAARKLGTSPGVVKKEIEECFPLEKENDNMDNIRYFAQKVNKEGKDNMFARLLSVAGQKRHASMLVSLFGRKGEVVIDQKKTVALMAKVLEKIESAEAKDSVELAAKKEFSMILSRMLKKVYDEIDSQRERFAEAIAGRIKELEKRHAKILSELRKIEKRAESEDTQTMLCAAGAVNVLNRIILLRKARRSYFVRASDILKVMRIRIMLTQFMMKKMTDNEISAGLNDMIKREPSGFVADVIGLVQNLLQTRAKGGISEDEMNTRLMKVYSYIDKVAAQLHIITSKQVVAGIEIKKLVRELEDLRNAVEFNIVKEYKERTDEIKELSKMGITEEVYKEARAPADKRAA